MARLVFPLPFISFTQGLMCGCVDAGCVALAQRVAPKQRVSQFERSEQEREK